MSDLWEHENPVTDYEINVPRWIDQDISPYDIVSINQGGCASGAYMPAVTYHQALKTMAEHGDDVLSYIEECYGEIPQPKAGESWSGMACYYLSIAIELWASSIEDELTKAIEEETEAA